MYLTSSEKKKEKK